VTALELDHRLLTRRTGICAFWIQSKDYTMVYTACSGDPVQRQPRTGSRISGIQQAGECKRRSAIIVDRER
jgi:hypothetical protein